MPELTAQELAESYGWSMALLRSDRSLWNLFRKAVAHSYEPQKFIAELRNTSWFRKHSESWRQAQALQKTDPAEWKAQLDRLTASLADRAAEMGSNLSGATLRRVAHNALSFGWNDAQIRNTMAQYVNVMGSTSHYGGQAGQDEAQLRALAANNGISLSDRTLRNWLINVAGGKQTVGDYAAYIRGQAESAFPAFAKQIKSGLNVSDIASPYMQSMASILEMPSGKIDLFNPTIRKALQFKDPGTGEVGAKPLFQFESELRRDPRWLQTSNAQNSLMGTAHQVLQNFGLAN